MDPASLRKAAIEYRRSLGADGVTLERRLNDAAARIERLEAIIQFSADRVSKIAFDIPPPNEQTPLLVMLANGMRAALAGKS